MLAVNTNTGPSREALYALAFKKLGQESFHDASALLRLMLHLAPKDERAWLGLGVCHEKLGQLRTAGEIYAAGCAAAKPSGRCALACARVLDRQGRSDSADNLYELAIEAFESVNQDELARLARAEQRGRL
jgi:Tfp pilus assembly protein PilF